MRTTKFAIALLSVVLSTGCVSSFTVSPLLVPETKLSGAYDVDQVHEAITGGLLAKGWSVESEEPGRIMASVTSGGHSATVRIDYDSAGWTIAHERSSEGLRFDPDRPSIHKRYNNWVKGLDGVIRQKLAASSG